MATACQSRSGSSRVKRTMSVAQAWLTSSSLSQWGTCCSVASSWPASCVPESGLSLMVRVTKSETWTLDMFLDVKLASLPMFCPGLMFPSSGDIHVAPFTDENLYFEHYAQASFWSLSCSFLCTPLPPVSVWSSTHKHLIDSTLLRCISCPVAFWDPALVWYPGYHSTARESIQICTCSLRDLQVGDNNI